MSTQAQPTGVATQDAEEKAVAKLPEELQKAVNVRRVLNLAAAKLAGTVWGKPMDLETRRQIADWGRRYGVDVVTEINILGNNIYLNGAFYINRLAQMTEQGFVDYAIADHVENDDRLADFPEEARRRRALRVEYQLPELAKSAVVARVKLKNTAVEFTAAKWCGGRGKNGNDKLKDPVGEEFPVETSETSAYRRVMRLLVAHVPVEAERINAIADSIERDLSKVLEVSAERIKGESHILQRQLHPAPVADVMDEYGRETERSGESAGSGER
jgi:hypothetical protein